MTSNAAEPEPIGARLAHVAARHPSQPALVERGTVVTYGDLDATATRVAAWLQANAGREPGRVALLFARRIGAIEAIFGAARSGHAYVMLDAGDPGARLEQILADCDPCAIVAEPALIDRARAVAPAGCAVLAFDAAARGAPAAPLPPVAADAPLYLYYTSGSTGRPKGAIQTHRNVAFFFDAYARALGLGTADRHSLVYTLSFNAANTDIYGVLLHGATLCAYDPRDDGIAGLADWIDRERITVFHSVPTVFREMCARLPAGRVLPHVRAVLLGGEMVFERDVELFRAHTLGGAVFANQLASTEAGLIAQHRIAHDAPRGAGAIVAAGRCPDGVRVEIRRDDGRIAPVGEPGRIVVCSAHLSPGYWRQPAQTDAAFSADPTDRHARCYASGDVGFVDAHGDLHFQGRSSGRVKVRGHSVDLAEVEAAVSSCPGVAQAAALARDGEAGSDSARIVAYVAATHADDRDARLLRRRLALRLPSYMLPVEIVFVDAFPVTATGKIDRRALAEMAPASATASHMGEPPRDDVEREIAATFGELLKVAPIGRDDDFFLLGGDSLLGVELQIRLRGRFGVHVGDFHEDATVAQIADAIRRERASPRDASWEMPVLLPLWRQGAKPPLFLVHGRHGQAFVSPHFMRLLGDDQPVFAFQARGLDGVSAPHPTVEAMAADYVAELRKVRPAGPYFIGSLCAGAYIAAIMARTLRDAGERVLPLLALDPPERLLQGGYAQMSEERFIAKMSSRRAQGGTAGPAADTAYMKTVRRVAIAFEQAIARYRPQPYEGPVYMLSSRQRMAGAGDDALRAVFSGRVTRCEVGSTHADALDPRNPVFASYLARCLEAILAAAPGDASTPADAGASAASVAQVSA